ncbi:MAG: alpha/beta hydrolase [Ignavibacteriae bacterium]|nr:alpha/beta hydrolase [Ignavibacteriota bacterium]
MSNFRKYGNSPHHIALIHGGPGAAGYLKPVAEVLSASNGILEPFQTAGTIDGQVEELRKFLKENSDLPVTLIGHSWGAWLSVIFASENPEYVNKLILVSGGPFDDEYVKVINETRMSRLSEDEIIEMNKIKEQLNDPSVQDKTGLLKKFGTLNSGTDYFCRVNSTDLVTEYRPDIFLTVNRESLYLRKSGKLLKSAGRLKCPVTAIHGDFDSHPSEGVQVPLSKVVSVFNFHLLEKCGHYPWNEKYAKDRFYEILVKELS